MRRNLYASVALVPLAVLSAHMSWAQGTTTSAMNGVITDKLGEGLPGATVIAVHTPTNTQYVAPTNSEGRFNLQNMRVGGPYTIRVSFVGYKEAVRENIFLTLGQNQRLDINLSESEQTLGEVVVTGRQDPVINAGRTGAATTVQREQIERLPTLNRSFNDFTRLTPSANGQSFGGRSGAFNNITIDGAIFNNSFGLSSTVGGQAGAQPISLDAIDQIQVSIAPFDVRQGSFTGAGINAVTRSGTNKVQASIYGFYRDQNLVGNKVGDVESDYPKFDLKNYGFRVGGPIIKDKLFFFLNAEKETRNDPPSGNFIARRPGQTPEPGGNSQTSRVFASDLNTLSTFLQEKYGFNPGSYEGYKQRSNSEKATARLDWNISNNHRLNIKYNYLRSLSDVPPSTSNAIGGVRAQTQFGLPFFSSYYTINNNLDSYIAELNSTFGSRFSNNFTAGYSRFRDFRESSGGIFPLVDIGNGDNLSTGNNLAAITASNTLTSFGYEPFSAFNILNSDVYQFGDNFTAYLGKHNVTVGTYNELYEFSNGFAPNYYGNYQFNSLADFYASARTAEAPNGYAIVNGVPTPRATGAGAPPLQGPQRYQLQYSTSPDGSFPFAVTKAAQFGLYAQDEWSPLNNLKITVGIRGDLPVIYSDIARNENAANLVFRDGVRLETDKLPNRTVLLSPRIGFNWDPNDDKKTQVRGGTGIFTGRIPFVWLSNQAGNNGVQFGSFDRRGAVATTTGTTTNPNNSVFPFDPNVDAYRPVGGAANTQYNLAVTDRDFKFPQVWRSNIAIDQELPGGIIGTIEALYTKDLNAVYQQNVNLPGTEAAPFARSNGADTRPIFYTFSGTPSNGVVVSTANNRIYGSVPAAQGGNTAARPNITDAILMKNTNKGYSYFVTGQLQKSFAGGFYASAAYTYSDARSVNDGGSIAQSIWRDRQVSGDPNANVLGYSNFLQQHRVVASASYRREYLNHLGTTISLFYEAAPAGRFSYVYSGDMNGDGQNANDLMYIPRNQSEINLRPITTNGVTYSAAQQWADLDAYISQDKYLSKNRGQYAERNGASRPWQNRLDVRLLQDIFTNIGQNRNALQISIDIFNVGNLINSDWGTFQTANRVNPLTWAGYNAQGQPVFEYRYLTNPATTTTGGVTTVVTPGTPLSRTFRDDTGGIGSRWQAQVGLRYLFN
ncbi:TonB-dependent receptor [Hymenobacter sp. 5516J-16]|uniref:TonB-dependent receptor n=1 Tax=Hymenobacter sublimis TaxID=2933777 RepID=A0ABY4JAH7_9BACT|nr:MULTISPECIES: TonB-dependent receptor [Hymenobacter]UOQ76151.1 TonB-dependent receptor [Hymenobacter sp. 5516J-16]UPL49820.1 TonB-dependent receptor [Hymenobacter sublimis]